MRLSFPLSLEHHLNIYLPTTPSLPVTSYHVHFMVPMRASPPPRSAPSSTCGPRRDYLTQTSEEPSASAENEASNEFLIWHRRIGPILSVMLIVGWVLGNCFRRCVDVFCGVDPGRFSPRRAFHAVISLVFCCVPTYRY